MSINNYHSYAISILVFFCAAFWGVYWIPLRYLQDSGVVGAFAVAVLNIPVVVALLILLIFRLKNVRGYWEKSVLIGMATGLGIALYSCALLYTSVMHATLLFYLTPVWATLLELFFLKQPVSAKRWQAIALSFIGMYLLLNSHSTALLNIGDAMAFFSGIFWAIGTVFIKKYKVVPILSMLFCKFLVIVVISLVMGLLFGTHISEPLWQQTQILSFISLVAILIFLPVVAVVFWAQKRLNPARVGLLMMSEVLVAVISASILIPEESLTLIEYIGAALIICACFMEVIQSSNEAIASNA